MTLEFDVDKAISTRLAERTKADIAYERRYQEEQRSKLPNIDQRGEHALRAIEIALHNLELNPDDDFEYTRLAEGYYLLGDFEKAAQTTRNKEKQAEYEAYANASTVKCACPHQVMNGKASPNGQNTTFNVSPRFVKDTFPGKRMIYCTNCKTYYVETAR